MADETHVLRGINWRDTFPFTHLFRTFRIAIHPSKLVLGLLALLTLYVGGRVFDAVWPARHLAVPGEVARFEQHSETLENRTFDDVRLASRRQLEQDYADRLIEAKIETDRNKALDLARGAEKVEDLKKTVRSQRDEHLKQLETDKADGLKLADSITDAAEKERARVATWEAYAEQKRELWKAFQSEIDEIDAIRGRGIFAEFFTYEVRQVDNVVAGVLDGNWLGLGAGDATPGVVRSVINFFTVGPVWLICQHTVYFIIFTLLFLLVWSIFGGAIARIAAVHVARDEKISVRQALKFSIGKLLSFVFAPIIPLLIVLGVGLVVSVVALIGNIPYVGPILVGAAFFLALIAGFVMALVLIGTFGGFNLMYPTIAVEGSDSFDAISRSFSYVYARPWRMLFYTAVAIIYGALSYLFVRIFIWLMLVLTHFFVNLGMQINAVNGDDLWVSMWTKPETPWKLTYSIPWEMLDWGGVIGASLLAFWVYLTIAMLGAFAISFYFSANTIIYYLMRHEVDATELDDVFLEQSEEEIAETTATPTTSSASSPEISSAPAPDAAPSEAAPPPQDNPPAPNV